MKYKILKLYRFFLMYVEFSIYHRIGVFFIESKYLSTLFNNCRLG